MAKKEERPDYTEMANWAAAGAQTLRGLDRAFEVFAGLRQAEVDLKRLSEEREVLANEVSSLTKTKSNLERQIKDKKTALAELEPLEQQAADLAALVRGLHQDVADLTTRRAALQVKVQEETAKHREAVIRWAEEEQTWQEKVSNAKASYQQLVATLAGREGG